MQHQYGRWAVEISWLGYSCFRLKGKDITIIADPYDQSIGLPLGRPSADIVTVSHAHPGHNCVRAVSGSPKVVDGPGEYEMRGVTITGIQTFHDSEKGRKRGKNTVYLIELDDLVVCHLGDLGHVLTTDQVQAMSAVDILLIPVGGAVTINAAQAVEVISLIEPKLVIPMHYKTEGLKVELEPLDKFRREMGLRDLAVRPKLTVHKNSLPEEPQAVVLEPRKAG